MATAVQEALRGISGTLEKGFTGLGRQRLGEAKGGFQRAMLGQQLGHYERFVKPGLEAQEAYLSQPANFGDLISDELGAIHVAQYVQPKIKKMYGADRWEGLTLVKKDGTPVTNRERQLRLKDEARLIYLNMKPSSLWKDHAQKVDNLLINMVEHHENPVSPKFQKAIRNQQISRENAFNPQKWIEDSQRQLQVALMYPDIYKDEIAQIRRNIMEYRKMLAPKKGIPFAQTEAGLEKKAQLEVWTEREKAKIAKEFGITKEGDLTPLMKNVPFIAKNLGISLEEATALLVKMKGKGPADVYQGFLNTSMAKRDFGETFDVTEARAKAAFKSWQAVADVIGPEITEQPSAKTRYIFTKEKGYQEQVTGKIQ